MIVATTPYHRGRLDGRARASRVLFGQMYEDPAIELAAFAANRATLRPGRDRVFSIASAGCTAMALAAQHDVVAIDINRAQLAYARARMNGAPKVRGTAEHIMGFARTFAPLVGWTSRRLRAFVELDDPPTQLAVWQTELDTQRLHAAFTALFSVTALRAVYASPLLACLPSRLGEVVIARMTRCFALHPNRTNPYVRALLLGEVAEVPQPPPAGSVELVLGDAAEWLERAPQHSFDAFTFSNILDGASAAYRDRLFAATRRAAAPDAVCVVRSFGEPTRPSPSNRAPDDRSMLWGSVDVRMVVELENAAGPVSAPPRKFPHRPAQLQVLLPVTARGAESVEHASSHVAPLAHDSEHDSVQRTVQLEPPAQVTLPLAPRVKSHVA
ncbi:hypothetical protein BH11MYX1_BH11MYX1_48020 [soil metagenome]